MTQAHDILTRTSWEAAPISEVVEGALAPHRTDDDRITCRDPALLLAPRQALALALAVHELATNAAKYGALSAAGRIDIDWSNDAKETKNGFRFDWRESGGPRVFAPTSDNKGFGSRLIERMLANDFNGKVTMDYAPTGLICELTAPGIDAEVE